MTGKLPEIITLASESASEAIDSCITNVLSEAQRKVRMTQEGAQQIGLVLHGAGGTACPMSETRQVERRGIGELVGLQVGPEIFDWVELRGIGRQVGEIRGVGRSAFLDELAEMSLEAVPDQHDRGA